MIRAKDFPEWTPPIAGYQYRFEIYKQDGYVVRAFAKDEKLGFVIEYQLHVTKDHWYADVDVDVEDESDITTPYYTRSVCRFSACLSSLDKVVQALHEFGKKYYRPLSP